MTIDRSYQGRWMANKLLHLNARIFAINAEMAETYSEARRDGVDVATIKSVVRHRRRERAKVLRRA